VRAALRHFDARDGAPAHGARFALPAVDREPSLEPPARTIGTAIVAKRRAAGTNRPAENSARRLEDDGGAGGSAVPGRERMDARRVQ